MRKNLFNDFFGIDDTEIESLVKNASRYFNRLVNEIDDNEDDKKETYSKYSEKQYKDGKLVKKDETEYVNGKCTKDEHIDMTKSIGSEKADKKIEVKVGDKCDCSKETFNCDKVDCNENSSVYNTKYEALVSEIEGLHNRINEMDLEISAKREENRRLKEIIDNIKNCF